MQVLEAAGKTENQVGSVSSWVVKSHLRLSSCYDCNGSLDTIDKGR